MNYRNSSQLKFIDFLDFSLILVAKQDHLSHLAITSEDISNYQEIKAVSSIS